MALEAVVFPQDLFIHNSKEWYAMAGGVWGYDFGSGVVPVMEEEVEEKGEVLEYDNNMGGGGGQVVEMCHEQREMLMESLHRRSWDPSCSSMVQNLEEWDVNSSSPEACTKEGVLQENFFQQQAAGALPTGGRRKRRRTKTCKNKEEVENQRMTHIAVERNRRKQMNEYLAVLRSLMPASYVQRGDQASIIGGAINFVKELEQLLQSLEADKCVKEQSAMAAAAVAGGFSTPFADFFTFPQYSMCSSSAHAGSSTTNIPTTTAANEAVAENRSAVADIEVTMVESHANLKVLSRRRPRQLLRMVVGLQSLRLTTLHLNVTTVDQMVLYSFSLKVEDDCHLNSADEIATAVYGMLGKIQEGSSFN